MERRQHLEGKGATYELSQEAKDYFKTMFDLMRVHAGVLGRAGINAGRSRMVIADYYAFDLINMLTDTKSWKRDFDMPSYDYIKDAQEARARGIPSIPKIDFSDTDIDAIIRVRTIFYWAEVEADKKDGPGSEVPYWAYEIGEPTKIIAGMLDDLIDPEEARARWIAIRDNPNDIEKFMTRTSWDFQDRLEAAGKVSIS